MPGPLLPRSDLTVAELLTTLDGSGLRLASRHEQLRLPLTRPTLYDRLAAPTGTRSGILLGIGLHPAAPETVAVVTEAAERGFGAIVITSRSLPIEALTAAADAANIALLVVDDETDWGHLELLINSALTAGPDSTISLPALALGDLFALANAIAATVGGATAIENVQEEILAYSTLPGQPIDRLRREGILGRQVPSLPVNAEIYAAVFRLPGAHRIPAVPPGFARLAIAVTAGTQPLGTIWVLDADGTLDATAERALERAAEMAALHLLRARSADDLVRQQRSELLRRLLEGGEESKLVVDQLGLDTSGGFTVLAIQPESANVGDELRLRRLVDLVAMQGEAHQHGTECVLIGNTVYALLTGPAASEHEGAQALADRLVLRAASSLRLPARAALGSTVTAIGQISRSRRDADLVLLLLASQPAGISVASAREVRSQLTILELAQVYRDAQRLMSPHARLLLDCDARTGTDYAQTLRTYLDCARDSAATASRLSMHPNTLRYRLRRVRQLFGVDLDNSADTLSLWLSLRIAEFD